MTDGTSAFNADFRRDLGFDYDLVKAGVECITKGLATEFEIAGLACTAVAVTPGWLRSESMLEQFGVTEENWGTPAKQSPVSTFRRRRRTSVVESQRSPPTRPTRFRRRGRLVGAACPSLRPHRRGRIASGRLAATFRAGAFRQAENGQGYR